MDLRPDVFLMQLGIQEYEMEAEFFLNFLNHFIGIILSERDCDWVTVEIVDLVTTMERRDGFLNVK